MKPRREYDEIWQLGFYLFWYDDVGVITPAERLAIKVVMREAKSVELSPPENRYAIDPQLEPYIERLNAAYCRVGERVLREGRDVSFVNRCPCCGRIVRTSKARQCMWCHHDWHDPRPT